MLVIRDEQMKAVGEMLFAERTAEIIKEEYTDDPSGISFKELLDEIIIQSRKASQYGLETEQNTATFVICAWLMGSDFATKYKPVSDVLSSEELTAEAKSQWLCDWIDDVFYTLEEETNDLG